MSPATLGETDILRVLVAEKRLILPILPLMLTYCPENLWKNADYLVMGTLGLAYHPARPGMMMRPRIG
jgi:hypothetical protein